MSRSAHHAGAGARPLLAAAAALMLLASLTGCVQPGVNIAADTDRLTLLPGERATITVTFNAQCDEDPVLLCEDIDLLAFGYVVRQVPPGVTVRIDESLRTPDTPTPAQITFEAGTLARPGRYEVAVAVTSAGLELDLAHTVIVLDIVGSVTTTAPPAALDAGPWHSLALLADGTVRAWGSNHRGRLGDGTVAPSVVPVPVTGLSGVRAVAAGAGHSLALLADGTVWSWGVNYSGQLGDGTRTDSAVPVQVTGLSGVAAVAAGEGHSLALLDDGTVWAWGANSTLGASVALGQLGDGSTRMHSAVPVQVTGLTGVRAIAAGDLHSLALLADGTVWAWGANYNGQLGDGTRTDSAVPVQVTGLSGVRAIAAGGDTIVAGDGHSLALLADGTVRAWGDNYRGQLGDGTHTNSAVPVQVAGLSGVQVLVAGGQQSLALLADGTVWGWGANYSGQLGDGTRTDSGVPVQMMGLSGVQAIAAGDDHTVAISPCGQVWAWGSSIGGQLGREVHQAPAPVSGLGDESACPRVTLRVSWDGDGRVDDPSGRLECHEEGLPVCLGVFDRGATVALTAVPGTLPFGRWLGDCAGGAAQTSIVLDASKVCAASFLPAAGPFRLTVTRAGSGQVTSSGGGLFGPERIDCGAAHDSACSAIFSAGTEVTLTAAAAPGFSFAGFSGDCAGAQSETTIVLNGHRSCRANFDLFGVTVAMSGEGRITSTPAGLDCVNGGGTCSYAPPDANSITLHATPSVGWRFDGWDGDCTGTEPQLTLALDAPDKSCSARFSRIPGQFLLDVTVEGQGSVTSAPPGIDCPGTACRAAYAGPSSVTLTAYETEQSEVLAVGGDCQIVSEPPGRAVLEVAMTADRTCRVIFQSRAPHPVAQFDVPGWPFAFGVGEVITFDARASYILDPVTGDRNPPGARITSITWDFGDGATLSGSFADVGLVQHVYQAPGPSPDNNYEVRLRVRGGVQLDLEDDEVRYVEVVAASQPSFQLTVQKAGSGSGIISTVPAGLLGCGFLCTSAGPVEVQADTVVTLQAAASPGSIFAGWSGTGCTDTAADIVVTMSANRTCTATFTPDPSLQYDLSVDVGWSGNVSVGEEALFTVNVQESPSTANPAVTVMAPLPPGLTFLRTEPPPPDFRGTYDPATGAWTFTMPEVGFIASMQIVARADAAGTYAFAAEIVSGLGPGDDPGNNRSEGVFDVLPAAALSACLSSVTQVTSGPSIWEVEADASCSSGPIAEYRWWKDFNFQGQLPTAITATPASPRFDYEEAGVFDIRLEVHDGNGNADAVQIPFTVQ